MQKIKFLRTYLHAYENSKQLVGVIVAMDAELEMIRKSPIFRFVGDMAETFGVQMSAYEYTTSSGEAVDIVVAKSGIGKVNAAVATTVLIDKCHPDYIISTGVCGTLSQQIVVQNDVYMPPFVTYYDVYCGSPNVIGQVQGYPERYETIFSNEEVFDTIAPELSEYNILHSTTYPIISGDMFVEDRDVARHICDFGYPLSDYCDCGIDMESTAIAQTCYRANIPFGTVRIVSDAPCRAEWLEQYKYEDFWTKAPDTLHKILKTVIDHYTYIKNIPAQNPMTDGTEE